MSKTLGSLKYEPHLQQVDARSTRALHDTGSVPVLYINLRQFDTTLRLVGRLDTATVSLLYILSFFVGGGGATSEIRV